MNWSQGGWRQVGRGCLERVDWLLMAGKCLIGGTGMLHAHRYLMSVGASLVDCAF